MASELNSVQNKRLEGVGGREVGRGRTGRKKSQRVGEGVREGTERGKVERKRERDRRRNARQCKYGTTALLPPTPYVTYFQEKWGGGGNSESALPPHS